MSRARPGRLELIGAGALSGTVLVATVVTYSRLDVSALYHVSVGGLRGGLGRALVQLNFPVALVAVPVALIALDVLQTRRAAVLATLSVLACSIVAVPGVVDENDLDAKVVNVVPALGVALAVGLAVAAAGRLTRARPRLGGDPLRIVLAAAIAIAAIPYWFAELGFYAPDPIRADEPTPGEPIASVHLGIHEGMEGALVALAMLALSRLTPWSATRRLAGVTSTVIALLLVYGVANLIQDDWHEQVVKRGWTAHMYGSVTRPEISVPWALIVLGGIAVELLWFRRERRARGEPQPAVAPASL